MARVSEREWQESHVHNHPCKRWPWRFYLARAPQAGLLKIGRSRHPESRVRILGFEVREPMELLDEFPVGLGFEFGFHQIMQSHPHRVRGEWYRDDPAILAAYELAKAWGIAALRERS